MGIWAPPAPWTKNWMAAVRPKSSSTQPQARLTPAASRARVSGIRLWAALASSGLVLYASSSEKLLHRLIRAKTRAIRFSQDAFSKIPRQPPVYSITKGVVRRVPSRSQYAISSWLNNWLENSSSRPLSRF